MTHEEQHDKNNNINSAEALERALQQMDDPEAIAAAIGMPGLSDLVNRLGDCLLYTSPSPRDLSTSRMPSSA